ncbi:hypothetical protein GCM10022223_43090 [Kineosporia mesophila]|uniref:SseB protein N-terminal domain-containing protein n=1 Tax=Kineosporia mesophila TaxID=566012 RepID=A0ABP7A0H1_9ACTN|nr:SAV_915 family protein [Kineosporia mesophila]MCD5353254.1 hypothetical protein [Kineosporia mesophila]
MVDKTLGEELDADRLLRGMTHPGEVFPPVVYVPCERPQTDGELTLDLRETKDGRLALLVYSAMDRLVALCGPEQPWTVMLAVDLEKARLATSFELILLDISIPQELRRTGSDL